MLIPVQVGRNRMIASMSVFIPRFGVVSERQPTTGTLEVNYSQEMSFSCHCLDVYKTIEKTVEKASIPDSVTDEVRDGCEFGNRNSSVGMIWISGWLGSTYAT